MDKNGTILSKMAGKAQDRFFCEITATHLTKLYEDYAKKYLASPEISFQIPKDYDTDEAVLLFKKITLSKMRYYLTILTKKPEKIASLKESFTEFVQGLTKTLDLSQ